MVLCFGQGNAQSFTSSDLPIVVIDTDGLFIMDDPKIEASMGIIYNGPGQRNFLTDAPNHFQGTIGIEFRGSSSQMFPKKQYGIELRGSDGEEIDASLLGLPPENDWILFAPYNDKTLMRDVLAYKLAADMGRYAPRTVYCELVLNGSYDGIYVLIEKIKRDAGRVDIAKLEPGEDSGDDLTGGYIIKIDKQTDDLDPGWVSQYTPPGRNGNQRIQYLYEYPSPDEISSAQKVYIQKFMSDFETALKSTKFADPVDGYGRYADVGSFVDFMIMNELTKNVDGYRLSTYMHKRRDSDGGKLVMGPVWDFNLGFGNANYCTSGTTDGLVLQFNSLCPGDWWLIPFWWDRLLQDAAFNSRLRLRWESLREEKLSTASIHHTIDSISTLLAESQLRNFERWPVLGAYVWPNYYVGETFEEEVDWLKDWVESRMLWLDNYFGAFDIVGTAEDVYGLTIHHPHPNPGVFFDFAVDAERPAVIEIILSEPSGRSVETHRIAAERPGPFSVRTGEKLAGGVYFYRVTVNGFSRGAGKLIRK